MTQNLTQATQPATRDQQIRLVITMNAQGKNRLNRFPFSDFDFLFFNPERSISKMHRIALAHWHSGDVGTSQPCEVGQCTTGLPRLTRQELPAALKSARGRSLCCILHQAIPAGGRDQDERP